MSFSWRAFAGLWTAFLLLTATLAPAVLAQRPDEGSAATLEDLLGRAEQASGADPAAAKAALDQAREALVSIPDEDTRDVFLARILTLESSNRMLFNDLDPVEADLQEAITLLQRVQPDGRHLGDALRSLAAYYLRTGQYAEALTAAQRAYSILREDEGAAKSQSLSLQIIGALYRLAGDYERALRYFSEAADVYQGDPLIDLAVQNNIGFTLTAMDRDAEAIEAYAQARANARALGNPVYEARILTNLAGSQLHAGQLDQAAATARTAARLTAAPGGENWRPFVAGVQAQIAAERGDLQRAATLFEDTFAGRDLSETDTPFRDFHETAAETYRQLGRSELALQHLAALKRLDDEAAEVTASAANALAAAQFDFANQELEIARLRAGQLERDVQLAEQEAVANQRIAVIVGIGAAIIVLLLLVVQRNIQRRRDEVHAANVELERTNTDLEKALAAKSEFLATTSHEIRTPLNGILGMTQIMLADGKLADMVRERVELVHGAGTTMKAIVDDILDVAKLDSGKIQIREAPFALRQTIREVAEVFADEARGRGVEFICNLDDCPERAIGDEQRVRQIVFNLVSNAVKFTNEGRVEVTARRASEADDDLLVTVSDTGVGIPPDQLDTIFSPFHQVDSSRTRQFSGTGLGLTISREFTHSMGGELAVASELGAGSTFSLRVPLKLTEANEPVADSPEEGGAASGEQSVVFAFGALTAAIMRRAFEGEGLDPQLVETLPEFQKLASDPQTKAAYLVYNSVVQAEIEPTLRALRDARPGLPVYLLGVPESELVGLRDLATDHITELARVSVLINRDGGNADNSRSQRSIEVS
ncbi:hypothetical protein B5C34_13020 [Pacificimonas flava]|uniref:histidine kinase n=2 Tax=Pacificimonas TaxID=1960290 RepID=A0A219B941_9SPHN|nr:MULTISPECIES: ATP-binding protein [Pacificimonas]MBZ6378410.1 tetratricopeptide repeat protein [Pacificimonas aurantium]OWV34288.1 hypothetical protein B5C34_13020 [Pacificimonas flava]